MLVFALPPSYQCAFRNNQLPNVVQSYALILKNSTIVLVDNFVKRRIFFTAVEPVRKVIVFWSHRSNRIWSLCRRISPALAPLTGFGILLLSVKQARLVRLRPDWCAVLARNS